jgi:hypothetical protein
MAIQYSVAVRNAQLDTFETTVGATAKLQIRTGAQPASCATAASGTLLCEMTLPADYMAAASAGSKALSGSWTGTASETGAAAHFRIVDNAGTTCHLQGSVTATGGGGDLQVDNTSITNGQTCTVTAFTITRGNA